MANVMEHGKIFKNAKKDKKIIGPNGRISKNEFHGKCFNFGKMDHKSSNCKAPKKNNNKNS